MGDRLSDSDENDSSRSSHEWELVPSSPCSMSLSELVLVSPPEPSVQEHDTLGLTGDSMRLLQMNYFTSATPSSGNYSSLQDSFVELVPPVMERESVIRQMPAAGAIHGERLLPLNVVDSEDRPYSLAEASMLLPVSPDWIETGTTDRSSFLVTGGDEDGPFKRLDPPLSIDESGCLRLRGLEAVAAVELCRTGTVSTQGRTNGTPSSSGSMLTPRHDDHFHIDQGRNDVCSFSPSDVVLESLIGINEEFVSVDTDLAFSEACETDLKASNREVGKIPSPDLSSTNGNNNCACVVWWRRQLVLWQAQARQASTLWSMAFAAAVVGLLIVGHRWHGLRVQNQMLRVQLCMKEKKISQLMYQLIKLKEFSSHSRRIPVIRV